MFFSPQFDGRVKTKTPGPAFLEKFKKRVETGLPGNPHPRWRYTVTRHSGDELSFSSQDAERSLRFYRQVFGVQKVFHQDGFIQAQTPGSRDVIVFEEKPARAGKAGGIAHFGFRPMRGVLYLPVAVSGTDPLAVARGTVNCRPVGRLGDLGQLPRLRERNN